mgnify:FL=1
MSRGNKIFLILLLFLFSLQAQAEERGINLNEIQPSFDLDDQPSEEKSNDSNFKFQASKKQDMSSSESFSKINLVILDKITSKQENFSIKPNDNTKFNTLEIVALNCRSVNYSDKLEYMANLQIKDISKQTDDKVFIYNGWLISNVRSNYTIEHSLYDIWLKNCI